MQLTHIILRFVVLFSILVSVFASLSTSAQNSSPSHLAKTVTKINYFGNEQGLKQPSVMDLVQDRHGFLWLATPSGIVRFDGDHFRAFDGQDSCLSQSAIHRLFIDSKERLWVGTQSGLYLYNEDKEKFFPFNKEGLLDQQIWRIYEDKQQRLWVSTATGLHIFNENQDRFDALKFTINDGTVISPKEIMTIFEDSDGFIWLGSDQASNYLIDPLLNKLYPLEQENPLSVKLPNLKITQILFTPNNDLILISKHQVLKVKKGNVTSLLTLEDGSEKLRRASFDSQGDLWISSNEGISRYQLTDNKLQLLERMTSSAAWTILKDKQNTMWFGTHLRGLGQHTQKSHYFKQLSASNGVLADDVVWSLAEDNEQYIWATGNSTIINRLDMTSKELLHYDTGIKGGKVIAFDKMGYVYIGSDQGLFRFDASADSFIETKRILSNKEVAYITVHGEYIYIGAWAEGLFRISLNEKDGFSQHRMSFEDKDIPFITTLNSQQDMLYIGTLTGLLVADSKNSLFKEVEQLKGQRVTFIHIAGNGTYVSTGDNGVYHFNSDLSQLLYHYNKNNIKGSAIYSV